MLTAAGATADTAALEALLAPGCSCREVVSYIKEEGAKGHRFTTVYTVKAVRVHDASAARGFATVTLSYPDSAVVDRQGRVVRALAGKPAAGRELGLAKVNGRWLLSALTILGG